jgi:hypothetical protein
MKKKNVKMREKRKKKAKMEEENIIKTVGRWTSRRRTRRKKKKKVSIATLEHDSKYIYKIYSSWKLTSLLPTFEKHYSDQPFSNVTLQQQCTTFYSADHTGKY